MDPELLRDNDINYTFTLNLTKKEIVEILYYIFETGWIDRKEHEYMHDFAFTLKVEMDKIFPNWEPDDLKFLHKELEDD